jgi:hypothetical protein
MRRTLTALLVLASLVGATSPTAPNPYQIYARARAVWESQRYPQYVSYIVVVNVDDKGVPKANHYNAAFDAVHDRVYTNVVSEEEQLDPHVPDGVNMSIDPKRQFRTLFKRRVGRPEQAVDYLGVPMLAPNYSFGIAPFVPQIASSQPDQAALVEEIREQFDDPMSAQKAQQLANASGLKEIGHVESTNSDYIITYDGIESVDGRDAYHLSLRPSHPSARLRLREIWIDTQTYATSKLETQGNFANDSIPWVITFADVDGAQYIATEDAQEPVSDGRYTYDRATITFQAITPGTLPIRDPNDQLMPVGQLLEEPPSPE